MADEYRYAVYFVPAAENRFTGLVNSLLGRESENAQSLTQPNLSGCTPARLEEITAEPRRYGLHATLKAPFYLEPGRTEADLIAAAGLFAATRHSFTLSALRIKRISSFLALTPESAKEHDDSATRLNALAGAALEYFDHLRRRPTSEETARRKSRSLSERQLAYLKAWGYPYVLEDYRFHLTLTGRMRDREEADKFRKLFGAYLGDSLKAPVPVDSICICRQPIIGGNAGDFHILKRFFFSRRDSGFVPRAPLNEMLAYSKKLVRT